MKVTGGWEKPYPDENAYSIISRMAMYFITPSHYLTGSLMFERNRPLAQYLIKPLRKSDLIRWEMDEGEDFYRRHVLEHSSYPVYGTILGRDRRQRLMGMIDGEELKDGREKYLTRALGCSWMRKVSLYYCPACVEEELARYGEPYWHRLHQLPGVDVCLAHHLELCDSGMTVRQINYRFIPLYYVIALQGTGKERICEDSFEVELAEDVSWLMDNGLGFGGRENLEMLIENNAHKESFDMNGVYSRARTMYGRLIDKYNVDAAYPKWTDMHKSYLYAVLMARAMGISVANL